MSEIHDREARKAQERLAPTRVTSDGVYDLNVDDDFRKLAKGRSTIYYEELMQYSVIESLLKQKKIDLVPLRRLVVKLARKSGAVKKNELQRDAIKNMQIDVDLFHSILKDIVSLTSPTS